MGIDEPLEIRQQYVPLYYHADGLGSIAAVTNASRAVAASYVYDAFGNTTMQTQIVVSPYGFTGREADNGDLAVVGPGLYYYRARYYDPNIGRFLNEDRERFNAGVNFYEYVLNNPVNNGDPFGLATPSWHWNMTYGLALQVFGQKCEKAAKEVADADKAVDDPGSFVGLLEVLTFQGPAWEMPGPHFPARGNVPGGVNLALNTCNKGDLGRALHSLQDFYFHYGLTPGWHYVVPLWDVSVIALNNHVAPVPRVSAAAEESTAALRLFKEKCLRCCN